MLSHNSKPRQLTGEKQLSAPNQSISQEGKDHEERAGTTDCGLFNTADKYIRSQLHSNAYQSVFTKENDKYQWLVLEQKSQSEVEVRQTDRHRTITAREKSTEPTAKERGYGVMRKLDTLVADFPNTYSLIGQDEVSKTYSFPKSYISYRKQRAVSTKQRERARQMMIERNRGKED